MKTTVAIIQQPAAILDLRESLRRGAEHIRQAAAEGSVLTVFPETWLTGYPSWVFGMAGWDDAAARDLYAQLLVNSAVMDDGPNDGLGPLREAARATQTTVVMGFNERAGKASGTLYNSLITIGPRGETLNLHRKLTPTHTERIVWATGDAAGLKVVDTPAGRVGGLVCWEHWHPLARQALHAQDEQIHVAAWPDFPEMHHAVSRTYAFEGRCFVLCAGQFLTTDDVPAELLAAYRSGVGPDAAEEGILFAGGSGVVAPDGTWHTEPVFNRPETILATIDLCQRDALQHDLDVAGHYGRSDVFELSIDRRRRGNGLVFRD